MFWAVADLPCLGFTSALVLFTYRLRLRIASVSLYRCSSLTATLRYGLHVSYLQSLRILAHESVDFAVFSLPSFNYFVIPHFP